MPFPQTLARELAAASCQATARLAWQRPGAGGRPRQHGARGLSRLAELTRMDGSVNGVGRCTTGPAWRDAARPQNPLDGIALPNQPQQVLAPAGRATAGGDAGGTRPLGSPSSPWQA